MAKINTDEYFLCTGYFYHVGTVCAVGSDFKPLQLKYVMFYHSSVLGLILFSAGCPNLMRI